MPWTGTTRRSPRGCLCTNDKEIPYTSSIDGWTIMTHYDVIIMLLQTWIWVVIGIQIYSTGQMFLVPLTLMVVLFSFICLRVRLPLPNYSYPLSYNKYVINKYIYIYIYIRQSPRVEIRKERHCMYGWMLRVGASSSS